MMLFWVQGYLFFCHVVHHLGFEGVVLLIPPAFLLSSLSLPRPVCFSFLHGGVDERAVSKSSIGFNGEVWLFRNDSWCAVICYCDGSPVQWVVPSVKWSTFAEVSTWTPKSDNEHVQIVRWEGW